MSIRIRWSVELYVDKNKKEAMKSRIPFPLPILPIAVIAMVFAFILPLCMKKEESNNEETIHVERLPANDVQADPFSDSDDPADTDSAAKSVVIKTKFVEITSGTEELGFDWIVPSNGALPDCDERRE